MTPRSGGCQCGSVRFTAEPISLRVTACHCGMCRRMSAGPELSVDIAGHSFTGEDHIRHWRSSDVAERAFCGRCGSGLYWRRIDGSEMTMSVGVFDDQSGFELTDEIFCEAKPDWYSFADDTTKHIGYGPEEMK